MENNNVTKPKKLKRHFLPWPILIALGIALLGQIIGGIVQSLLTRLFNPSPMWKFTIEYFSTIGTVIVVVAFCAKFEKPILKTFLPGGKGGLKGNNLKNFFLGILFGFLMNGGCILLAWLHGDLHFSIDAIHPLYLILTFFCVCIQSSSEEMVTRGYMYQAHIDRYPAIVAILANSLTFVDLHLLNPGITITSFLQITLCGVALSLAVFVCDSIWMAYGVHTMWNYTQSILFGLPNSGIVSEGSLFHLDAASESIFYDPAFGIEGAITSVVAETALCIGLLIVLYMKKKKASPAV